MWTVIGRAAGSRVTFTFEFRPAAKQGTMAEENNVYMAKLAEQAERYDEMVEYMKAVAETSDSDLTLEERNLLSVAYKNVVGARRASLRIIGSIKQKENEKGATEKANAVANYQSSVRKPHLPSTIPAPTLEPAIQPLPPHHMHAPLYFAAPRSPRWVPAAAAPPPECPIHGAHARCAIRVGREGAQHHLRGHPRAARQEAHRQGLWEPGGECLLPQDEGRLLPLCAPTPNLEMKAHAFSMVPSF